MAVYKEYRVGGQGPFSFLGPLLVLALIFGVLFFVVRGGFWILSWAAPILFFLTLVIDHKVVISYFKTVWRTLKENFFLGLIFLVMTIVGYPFVAGYLFFKALGRRSLKNRSGQNPSESDVFTDFVEVVEDKDFLEVPELKVPKPERTAHQKNTYDDVF